MSFFNQFPTTNLGVGDEIKKVVDIFRHVDVNDILSDQVSAYQYYDVKDGERPDNVSQRLYGTPDYYWTFFILNETLKNGIDDWPKSDFTIENEFQQEYDDIGVLTFLPEIKQKFTDMQGNTFTAPYVANSFNGLDLSYEGLRVIRNFESARIVKWDSNLNQLWLTDFTNKERFMGDSTKELRNHFDSIEINGRVQGGIKINWSNLPNGYRSKLHFWFDDWPQIGVPIGEKSGRPGALGSDGRLLANPEYVEDANGNLVPQNEYSDPNFRRKTMTAARLKWLEHLFEWHASRFVAGAVQNTVSTSIKTPLQKYQDNARFEVGIASGSGNISIHRKREMALDIFYGYFVPYFVSGQSKFDAFNPYRLPAGADEDSSSVNLGPEHKFLTAREAPHHYFIGDNGFDEDNIVQSWQVLSGNGYERAQSIFTNATSQGYREVLEGSDPRKFVSNHSFEINKKINQSRIKVVRPDIIGAFAQAYKAKLNAGLSRTQSILGTTPNAAVARAAGSTVINTTGSTSGGSFGASGVSGNAPATSGPGVGGGGY